MMPGVEVLISVSQIKLGLLLQARAEYAYKIKYLDVQQVADAVLFALHQSPNCAVNSVLIQPILGPI